MSDLRPGDRVVLIREDIRDISWSESVPKGTCGTLIRLYRVQDGREIWEMWLDKPIGLKQLLGVTDLDVEKE